MFLRMGPIGTGLPPKRCTTLFLKGFGDSNQASIPRSSTTCIGVWRWHVKEAYRRTA